MFNRRRMFPRQRRTYLNPMPENNQERAEQHIEDESEEEKEQLTSEPIETSRAVVHTLMPGTYVVISMNSKDFSSLIARTIRQLYEEECHIPI